jgi:hypothetical protein
MSGSPTPSANALLPPSLCRPRVVKDRRGGPTVRLGGELLQRLANASVLVLSWLLHAAAKC